MISLLNESKSCKNLQLGRMIHAKSMESGNEWDMYVVNALISMYRKCGSMLHARHLFDRIEKPNVVHWNTLLLGYAENGDAQLSLKLFSRMKEYDCRPNCRTYLAAIKACTFLAVKGDGSERISWLQEGIKIQLEMGSQLELDQYVQGALIDMYAKCGSMVYARCVFESIGEPDVVSWTALVLGYAENEEPQVALDLFSRMKQRGLIPTSVTYIAALKACSVLAIQRGSSKEECLRVGRAIHLEIGFHLEPYVQGILVDMYSKCGSMEEARTIFNNMHKPDIVAWTSLLLGYTENGEAGVALDLFVRMRECGCPPDSRTYVVVLKACGLVGALALGTRVHSEIIEFTPHLITCLVDFYGKCGSLREAHEVFDLHPSLRTVRTWTALIASYGRFGDSSSVFAIFQAMKDAGLHPNDVTFVCLLLCCSHSGLVEKAREYFEVMPAYGVARNVMHYTCMVDVLGRGNQLNEAIVMIRKMPCTNAVTWLTLLGACHKWKNVEIGGEAYQALAKMDTLNASSYVLMADIYGSSGMWEEQQRVLETRAKLEQRDVTDELRRILQLPECQHYNILEGD